MNVARAGLLLTTVAVVGCISPQADDPLEGGGTLARSPIPTWEEYLAAAVPIQEGGYVVESDLLFPNDVALRQYYDSNVRVSAEKAHLFTQAINGNWLIWPGTKAVDIRYCVSKAFFDAADESFYDRAVADMDSATKQWETLANIDFKHVVEADDECEPGHTGVDFVVGPFSATIRGCADPPGVNWDDQASTRYAMCYIQNGTTVYWSMDILALNYPQIDAEEPYGMTPVGVLRHELGHKLGFSHEHPWNTEESCTSETSAGGAYDGRAAIDGVPYDEMSVMHYPGALCSPQLENFGPPIGYHFSRLDGVSARSVYGVSAAWYHASLYVAAGVI